MRRDDKCAELIPMLKLVPNSEVEEKLGDVWIVPGKVTLTIDNSERIVTLPSDKPIVFDLQISNYQCDLVSSNSGIMIRDSEMKNNPDILLQ